MLNIVVCDDEKEQRRLLRRLISGFMDLRGLDYTFYEFNSGEDLLADYRSDSADLIFLDIEMRAMNGMETARLLRRKNSGAVLVFITAYDDYVFQGYDVRALSYILKPYSAQKIKEILDQALEILDDQGDDIYIVETKGGVYKLFLKDVYYFMSDKRKVIAVTKGGKFEFYQRLSEVKAKLPAYFVRCHRRYLLNINQVSAIEGEVAKVGDELVPISRGQYQVVMIAFAKAMLS